MKKYGFTLAEVLITLGIIGVVAAITLPTLVQNYKKAILQTQLKAAYADLNKASMMFKVRHGQSVSEAAAYSDYAGSPTTEANYTEVFKLFTKEFTAAVKSDGRKYGTTDEEGNLDQFPYDLYTLSKNSSRVNSWICDASGSFWDPQGRVISMDDAPAVGQNGPKICIDINGEKKPNRLGMDFFVFLFTVDGQVIPFGQSHKNNPAAGENLWYNDSVENPEDYCQISTDFWRQIACSNFALINQHPSEEGKDYWHDFLKGW